MAIDAKVSFINLVEKGLATEITLDAMNRVMRIIADTLETFEMRETFAPEERQEDLLDAFISALKVQGDAVRKRWYVTGTLSGER